MTPIVRAPDDPGVDDEGASDEFAPPDAQPEAQAGGWRGSCLVGGRSRIGSDGIGARLPRLILTRFRHVNRARTHVGLPPFFLQNRTVADIRLRGRFRRITEPASGLPQ